MVVLEAFGISQITAHSARSLVDKELITESVANWGELLGGTPGVQY